MPMNHPVDTRRKATFSHRPFEKLRKKIEGVKTLPKPCAPPAPEPVLHADEDVFSAAMIGVSENREFREMSYTRGRKRSAIRQGLADPEDRALETLGEIIAGRRPVDLTITQEYVEWTNPDYQSEITERLHTGRFSVQRCLDLHGCTVDEASDELDGFLQDAVKEGVRCVKIIHGRGLRSPNGPVVKNAVVKLLSFGKYRKRIIAYVTARQCDGGLGALYVLLAGQGRNNMKQTSDGIKARKRHDRNDG